MSELGITSITITIEELLRKDEKTVNDLFEAYFSSGFSADIDRYVSAVRGIRI